MMLRVQAVALLRRALAHAVYASFEVAAHPRLLLSFVSDSWNEYLNLKSSDVVVSRVSAWLLYLSYQMSHFRICRQWAGETLNLITC